MLLCSSEGSPSCRAPSGPLRLHHSSVLPLPCPPASRHLPSLPRCGCQAFPQRAPSVLTSVSEPAFPDALQSNLVREGFSTYAKQWAIISSPWGSKARMYSRRHVEQIVRVPVPLVFLFISSEEQAGRAGPVMAFWFHSCFGTPARIGPLTGTTLERHPSHRSDPPGYSFPRLLKIEV